MAPGSEIRSEAASTINERFCGAPRVSDWLCGVLRVSDRLCGASWINERLFGALWISYRLYGAPRVAKNVRKPERYENIELILLPKHDVIS